MEKKTYIKPEIEVVETELTEMLALSFEIKEDGGDDGSLATGRRPERRGKWGDLWYVEEEE